MTPEIQDKEIRGITVKVIVAVFFSFAGIIATIMGTYSNIISKMEVTKIILDSKIERLEYRIEDQGMRINNLEESITDNKKIIESYHGKRKNKQP